MHFFKKNAIILSLCVIYIITGLLFIETNTIAGDEPFSLYFSGQSYQKIWVELFNGNNPPLYELFLKSFSSIFGKSVISFRLPSLLFATTTLFLFYQFLRKYFSLQAAICFGLMYLFSDYFITFSLEARGYSLLNFLICTSTLFFFRGFVEQKKSSKYWLVLVNCLLLLTHYLSAIFIVFQVTVLLTSPEIKSKIKNIVIYYGITGLIMSPLIAKVFLKVSAQKEMSPWPGPPSGINDMYNLIWRFSNKPILAVLVIAIFIIVPAIILVRKKHVRFKTKHVFFAIWFPLFFVLMYFISFKIPMFVDRYLMVLALGFYGLIAVLLSVTFKKKVFNWMLIGLIVMLFGITHRWVIDNKRPLNKIATWIEEHQDKNTQTILSEYQLLHGMSYHLNRKCFFTPTNQLADLHLLECLALKNVGFDFTNPTNLIVIEKGTTLPYSIQNRLNEHYTLQKEGFLPEFFKLKKYSKE